MGGDILRGMPANKFWGGRGAGRMSEVKQWGEPTPKLLPAARRARRATAMRLLVTCNQTGYCNEDDMGSRCS